jgi:mannose-6-phosphate isomerase-like protein (cupin superfamily)
MSEISIDRAKREHGVIAIHEQMPNGEMRFRLRKRDGTAYIRTEAGATGGWQNSHFHQHVMETYVVQAGWMAFAELLGEELSLRRLTANEIVTSCPGVVHNVYLSGHAVIHTVKHGEAQGNDRLVDERTAAFDKVTHALQTEADIISAAIRPQKATIYSEEYRHFDNLIWQVPAWSTGIFAISIQALFNVVGASERQSTIAAVALSLFTAICLACFSFVMMRFRKHQRGLKRYPSTPAWLSASTITQSLVTVESAGLLAIALAMLRVPLVWSIGAAIAVATALIIAFECSVRRT